MSERGLPQASRLSGGMKRNAALPAGSPSPGGGWPEDAVDNFTALLAILREWDEEERGKTRGDDANKE